MDELFDCDVDDNASDSLQSHAGACGGVAGMIYGRCLLDSNYLRYCADMRVCFFVYRSPYRLLHSTGADYSERGYRRDRAA